MSRLSRIWCFALLLLITLVAAQQNCYYAPGAEHRGPSNLVPCLSGDGNSACCLQGDTCLSGNACYNFESGNVYQYGCTDIDYEDVSCPSKCEWDTTLSPWTALEYCDNVPNVTDTWICHAPESCGCEWNHTLGMLNLTRRGCKEMGSEARVALYAPTALMPYVSLPATYGGSTGYYSAFVTDDTTTWLQTAVDGYTPSSISPLTTYSDPKTIKQVEANATPSPSTWGTATPLSVTATSTSTNPAAASSTGNGTASQSSASASASASASDSSGLSTGAKAGIGVGVAGGVCGILALAIAGWMMRKRQRSARAKQEQQAQEPEQTQIRYPGAPYENAQEKYAWQRSYSAGGPYSPGQTPSECHGTPMEIPKPDTYPPQPMELSVERVIHEMGSDVTFPSELQSPVFTYAEVEAPSPQHKH